VNPSRQHRLEGFEPDNLLAFLALLGLLRALEAHDLERVEEEKLYPRACWDLDTPPLRPLVFVTRPFLAEELLDAICRGGDLLVDAHEFNGQKDLRYSRRESRTILEEALRRAGVTVTGSTSWRRS